MVNAMNKPKQMSAYDRFEITGDGYILYDDDPYFDSAIEDAYENPLQDFKKCAYCSTILLKIEDQIIKKSSHRDYCLWYCRNCRFWQARLYSDPFGACMSPPDHWAYVSKLREFNTDLPEGCSKELALYLRQHPQFFHSCHPKRFEKFVADVYRANYTNAEVLHVGRPHDGGIDVLLIDAGGEQWLIQVKRRESPNRSEGVSTIRDILGAMVLEGVRRGIVVSTAKQFSTNAQQAMAKAKKRGMTVQLVDKGILNKMLDPILPDRPWLLPISQLDAELASYLADQIPSDYQYDLFTTPQHF